MGIPKNKDNSLLDLSFPDISINSLILNKAQYSDIQVSISSPRLDDASAWIKLTTKALRF
jgi:hypothetical protein